MELKLLPYDLAICRLESTADVDLSREFFFLGKTDEELSLVCRAEDVPSGTLACDAGWKGFRIQGVLDFSLIGILSKLTAVLAQNNIGVFAVSTYNTDYILVKSENCEKAENALVNAGCSVR